jgi:putative transcriptional regulator
MPFNDGDSEAIFNGEAHKKRLGSGAVLVARDLNDPNFSSSVVLLCRHGSEGAYGLVLNRPSHMPLAEIFEQFPATASIDGKNRRVYVGGPVQPSELQVLSIDPNAAAPDSVAIAPGVNLGGVWNELEEILSKDASQLRLFLGYSGWAAGQLEREVEEGAWEVFQIDVQKLLTGAEQSWFGGLEPFKRFLASM